MSTRRIMGVETEFGITFTHEGQRKLAPDDIARQLFRPVVERHRSSNIYLTNGGRLYLDVGSHPEYATPECDSLSQLLVYDRAGEVVMNQLAATAETTLHGQGIDGTVHLLKNNTDSLGNSYGCHENYLVGRTVILKHLGQQFIPFLISRQIICGAGLVHDGTFTISQRSTHMWEGVSSATTRSRPIINTRDEPHADSERFRRLHVIVGDSNMSEITNALKYGTSLLVLEMLEAGEALGFDFSSWEIANDAAAIRAIDLDPLAEVALRDGRTVRGVDIQRAYYEAAVRWVGIRDEHRGDVGSVRTDQSDTEGVPGASPSAGTHDAESTAAHTADATADVTACVAAAGTPDAGAEVPRTLSARAEAAGTPTVELRSVVELWGTVLDAVERGDLATLAPLVDWAMKKSIIQQYQAAKGWDMNHPVIKQVDYAYHDIHPQRGLARVLEAKGRLHRWQPQATSTQALPTPEQAVTQPPASTRASARGRFLATAQAHDIEVAVDWTRLKISGGAEVAMLDPFIPTNSEVETIIDTLLEHAAAQDEENSAQNNG